MKTSRTNPLFGETVILIILGLVRLAVHISTNGQYGFHRDELAILDEARHLAWGYVAYPPLTPFIGRMAVELFGFSLKGIRFFSALAQCTAMVITGLMARRLGGHLRAQVVATLATGIAPLSLIQGALFQYVSFDYLWWVLSAYFVICLLTTDDARWWLAIGAVLGLGMMTKTTMAFCIAGIVGSVLLTSNRRYLKSPWLWLGAAFALSIFLPNLIWQWQHDFVTFRFLTAIHTRDVNIGRAENFIVQQPVVNANPLTLPLWVAGLCFYMFARDGKRYRMLGWMYLIPLLLFSATQARFYYLAPAYPMLLAAGSVIVERRFSTLGQNLSRFWWGLTGSAIVVGAIAAGAVMLPVAPINSGLWGLTVELHDNFAEQIGWEDMVKTVSDIYAGLPEEERQRAGILAGNYGEAGAIDLYGPAYNLPTAISGVNSYWWRGYGDPPPLTLIVLGFSHETAEKFFFNCELTGRITNRYGVVNEETRYTPNIYICHGGRKPWHELWPELQSYG